MKNTTKWWEIVLFLAACLIVGYYSVPAAKWVASLIERLFLLL